MAYTVSSGITSDGIELSNDSMTVQNGGLATNITVNGGGRMNVSGTVLSTTVNDGGQVVISSGGSISHATISSGGTPRAR